MYDCTAQPQRQPITAAGALVLKGIPERAHPTLLDPRRRSGRVSGSARDRSTRSGWGVQAGRRVLCLVARGRPRAYRIAQQGRIHVAAAAISSSGRRVGAAACSPGSSGPAPAPASVRRAAPGTPAPHCHIPAPTRWLHTSAPARNRWPRCNGSQASAPAMCNAERRADRQGPGCGMTRCLNVACPKPNV